MNISLKGASFESKWLFPFATRTKSLKLEDNGVGGTIFRVTERQKEMDRKTEKERGQMEREREARLDREGERYLETQKDAEKDKQR